MSKWQQAQASEYNFHNKLRHNFFLENQKQLKIYAPRMKFTVDPWFNIDFQGKSVIDFGGGWDSMLLKGKNLKKGVVIDPLISKAPNWVRSRYDDAKIEWYTDTGEDFRDPFDEKYDLVIGYNLLQHVEFPEKLVKNMKAHAKEIRVFEFIDVPVDEQHLHTLTAQKLNEWFGTKGVTEYIREENTFTNGWYAVIKNE